jgi:carbon-monoxide dehydrogenase catalytic subunit
MATVKSIDPAVNALLEYAEQEKITTAFSRAEAMKPCPIGHIGACCKHCHMGPCRLVKPGQTGVCGATIETVTSRNFARMIAVGSAAHSDHGRDLVFTLLAAAEGEAPDFRIRDERKLREVARFLGVAAENRGTMEIARDVALKAMEQFTSQRKEAAYLRRAPQPRQEIWRNLGIAPRGIDREVVDLLHRTHIGEDQDHLPRSLSAADYDLNVAHHCVHVSTAQ